MDRRSGQPEPLQFDRRKRWARRHCVTYFMSNRTLLFHNPPPVCTYVLQPTVQVITQFRNSRILQSIQIIKIKKSACNLMLAAFHYMLLLMLLTELSLESPVKIGSAGNAGRWWYKETRILIYSPAASPAFVVVHVQHWFIFTRLLLYNNYG